MSGPDANSCQGCHNAPFGIAGGRGDFVTSVVELAERFDFVTFEQPASSLMTVGNLRATPGLFGAGYLEMLARQITRDLQRTRDSIQPGQSKPLRSQGIAFGTLSRRADGTWNTRAVDGLPPQSSRTSSAASPLTSCASARRPARGWTNSSPGSSETYHRRKGVRVHRRVR